MMSSESSTERRPGARPADTGIQPWHLYLLLSMAAATWAVLVSPYTHPAALAVLSAAIIAAGLVGAALHYAVAGFFGISTSESIPPSARTRELLENDKALVLRSIKELEFDRAMRKVSETDFAEIDARLRARALSLMQQLEEIGSLRRPGLERNPYAKPEDLTPSSSDNDRAPIEEIGSLKTPGLVCTCGTANDADAKFCKNCGAKL